MTWRLAINGYGRIGQSVLRALYESRYRGDIEIVAINELSDLDTIAYLTRYDTTHGRFPFEVESLGEATLGIDGDEIAIYRCDDIASLPWQRDKIDLVLECTGVYKTRHAAQSHLACGAKRVLFSHPAETDSDVDQTIVYGVNHQVLSQQDQIVSNASCTTNAIVPVLDALNRHFGIESGTLTTLHSVMNDQPTIDAYHHRDLRRTRSAMQNIVPVETALAKGVERLLPELDGKLTAAAIRVPTINVSAIDLSVNLQQTVSVEAVNSVLKLAAQQAYGGIMSYTQEPLASSDFNHDCHSCIVDGSQTQVSGGRLVKLLTWFDNEWAFANRMLDVSHYWLSHSK